MKTICYILSDEDGKRSDPNYVDAWAAPRVGDMVSHQDKRYRVDEVVWHMGTGIPTVYASFRYTPEIKKLVHNHPPNEPPCEEKIIDGRLVGACLYENPFYGP